MMPSTPRSRSWCIVEASFTVPTWTDTPAWWGGTEELSGDDADAAAADRHLDAVRALTRDPAGER
jgi:hypothetical protein